MTNLFFKEVNTNFDFITPTLAIQCWIFQTRNSVKLNNRSLKYQKFLPTGGKNIWIRKFLFATKVFYKYLNQCFGRGNKPNPQPL